MTLSMRYKGYSNGFVYDDVYAYEIGGGLIRILSNDSTYLLDVTPEELELMMKFRIERHRDEGLVYWSVIEGSTSHLSKVRRCES